MAQGTIRGKITDDLGESIIGAAIVLKSDLSVGTVTDFDGKFSLEIKSNQPETIIISFISYKRIEKTVNPKNGEVVVLNFSLEPESFDIGEVVIESKANRAGDFFMEKIKQNSATSIDYISSETINKIGDRDVSSAVRRVSGVSTVGGFVAVRGLADRYIKTTVNGSKIPTLDPFTNNINLDIFATGLVDNIVITKTSSPALPGDWSGAYISIETKDYPDQLSVDFNVSFGYNTQATFKDVISGARSSTDWLGFDDGLRGIADGVPLEQANFPNPINSPNLYQQFQSLGLQGYLNSLGIVSTTPITQGGDFHRLGLVELGLLGAAEFNNGGAFNSALNQYNELYPRTQFFQHFNQELADIGGKFPNTWINETRRAPMNFTQNLTIGNQTKLFGKTLGFIVGFRYSTNNRYDPTSVINRTSISREFVPADGGPQPIGNELAFQQQTAAEINSWNILGQLSYKLNNNNSVSFIFMPNFLGESNSRTYFGQTLNHQPGLELVLGDDQYYFERKQIIYQAHTTHFIPSRQIKIDFNASYTDGERNVLDFKETRYLQDAATDTLFFQPEFNPNRRFRLLDENLLDARISAEMPLESMAKRKGKLTVGGNYVRHVRKSSQLIYQLNGLGGTFIPNNNPTEAFAIERFGIEGREDFDLNYANAGSILDNDVAFGNIGAAFAMIDFNVIPRLRFQGGVRVETTDLFTDIEEYYERGLEAGHPDRQFIAGVQANPGEVQSFDVLPSLNFIYKLGQNAENPTNLRVNYFHSLARPGFREMSPVSLEDYELRGRVTGNTDLELVNVRNYDLRLESYFKKGDNISMSVFFKNFINHIELLATPGGTNFTWENADKTTAVGIEIEGKKTLIAGFDLRGNVSFINSETTINGPITVKRQMFGQAPYIVNGMLTYTNDSLRFSISASYNVQGRKLAAVNIIGNDVPDIYELPMNMVDINVIKHLGKHFSVGCKVRNLLNTQFRRVYVFDSGYELDFDFYRWGTEYSVNFAYRL